MIRALRGLHRATFVVLAVVIPVGFIAGVAARPEMPTVATPVGSEEAPPAPPGATDVSAIWTDVEIATRYWRAADGGGYRLELAPRADLARPDVLVYLAPALAPDGLPAGAELVGRLAGTEPRRFDVPPGAPRHVILYSLGHQQQIASSAPLPELPP